ncbi:MAG: universal stress protein [Tetrasphaera sp.]
MTIVVGFIPTNEGRAAFDRAVAECELRKVPLVVVNSARGGRHDEGPDLQLEDELEQLLDQTRARGVEVDVHTMVRGNEPAEDLIEVARNVAADFIVIGLRRRTPVGKLILGSNAQRVLLDSPCAVLAVKAEH